MRGPQIQKLGITILVILGLLTGVYFSVTYKEVAHTKPQGPLGVSLRLGVDGVVLLGDTLEDLHRRSFFRFEMHTLGKDNPLKHLGFSECVRYGDLGVTSYFRFKRIALIVFGRPFNGIIHGIDLMVFDSPKPEGGWDPMLRQLLGRPEKEASTGTLVKSDVFFYEWGDLIFTNMGPELISLYRDPDIALLRRTNTSQSVNFFGQP